MNGSRQLEFAGWEAFVHGVFAITITLLVLDIRVPPIETTPTASSLVNALLAEGPRYAAYALSFMYVGLYWIATLRSLRMARAVDQWSLVLGLVYLMSVAVVPFVSALLAEYVGADQGRSQVVVILFMGWQLVVALLAYTSLLYSSRAGLLASELDEATVRRWLRLSFVGFIAWIAAIAAALVVGWVALAIPGILLVAYLRGTAPARQRDAGGNAVADAGAGGVAESDPTRE